jgi:hypothetical protein
MLEAYQYADTLRGECSGGRSLIDALLDISPKRHGDGPRICVRNTFISVDEGSNSHGANLLPLKPLETPKRVKNKSMTTVKEKGQGDKGTKQVGIVEELSSDGSQKGSNSGTGSTRTACTPDNAATSSGDFSDESASPRNGATRAAGQKRDKDGDKRLSGIMLMLCNIPNNRRPELVMEAIDEMGYSGYDYIYVPLDRHSNCNKGYGFVHFPDVEEAYRFMKDCQGFQFEGTNSSKTLNVCVARRQSVLASLRSQRAYPVIFDKKGRQTWRRDPWVRINGVMECVPPQTAIQLCSGPASEEEPSA